jgi:6,7-dimethyl-8-ribityllumazine synthase
MKLVIVAGVFHADIAAEMVAAAKDAAKHDGWEMVSVVEVPGSFEVPLAVARVIKNEKPDAVVTLGYIEKGETLHGEVIGHVVYKALLDLQLQHDIPIGLGIIGPGATREQAEVRSIAAAEGAVGAVTAVSRL